MLEGAVIYLQIIFIGILGGAAYNILAGVLRGLGDSLMPLLSLLVASLLNIVLDILFVSQFHMGIAGVAWATIIAPGDFRRHVPDPSLPDTAGGGRKPSNAEA